MMMKKKKKKKMMMMMIAMMTMNVMMMVMILGLARVTLVSRRVPCFDDCCEDEALLGVAVLGVTLRRGVRVQSTGGEGTELKREVKNTNNGGEGTINDSL